jgi:hypothetical protein
LDDTEGARRWQLVLRDGTTHCSTSMPAEQSGCGCMRARPFTATTSPEKDQRPITAADAIIPV